MKILSMWMKRNWPGGLIKTNQNKNPTLYFCKTDSTLIPGAALPTYCIHRYFWSTKSKTTNKGNKFGRYSLVIPEPLSPRRHVPDHIIYPDYAKSGVPNLPPLHPEIKTPDKIDKMRVACKLARKILNSVGKELRVGMTTDCIDRFVHEETINHGAYPSPLNYYGYPKSVCTSVNNVVCHGIPDYRLLEDGDIITVDVTLYIDGHHGDCSETFLIGDVDDAGRHLAEAARICRDEAIWICGPGRTFWDIGAKVMETAKSLDVTVVPALAGHGIGWYFHGYPEIYHTYNDYPGTMEPGMTFTIEPCVSQGSEEIELLEDGWTTVTVDGGRAAQCEQTILITEDGAEVLTGED